MTNKYLIQLLLPVFNKQGEPTASEHFQLVRHELSEKFGGITVYSRSPADGLWKDDEDNSVQDEVVLFEVVVEELNAVWWQHYLKELQRRFSQDQIHCRVQTVSVL